MPVRMISPRKNHNGILLFYTASSPFSNFHPVNFKVDFDGKDIIFNCSEQYFMYRKALLAGDQESASEILILTKPLLMKRAGRKLEMSQQMLAQWSEISSDVMYTGCYAKFSQNEKFRLALFRTRGMLLAEASARDKLWGIGLGINDSRSEDPKTWKGENRLGKILEKVRDELWENEQFRRDRNFIDQEDYEKRLVMLKKIESTF